jgi:hypothetical protein
MKKVPWVVWIATDPITPSFWAAVGPARELSSIAAETQIQVRTTGRIGRRDVVFRAAIGRGVLSLGIASGSSGV